MRTVTAVGTVAAALVVGVAAGAMFIRPAVTDAQSPTASPAPGATAPPSTGGNGSWGGNPGGMPGGHGPGGRMTTEAVTDTSVAATAIGISEAGLTTALNGGQTIAAVAKAHNVDPQKVIDALVADGRVRAGRRRQGGHADPGASRRPEGPGDPAGHGPGQRHHACPLTP